MATYWSGKNIKEIEKILKTDLGTGLSEKESKAGLENFGPNAFSKGKRVSILKIFLRQFESPLVLILVIAGIITLFISEYLDATVIFIALSINVIIGVFQEERADRSFQKLNSLQQKYATVLRDGHKKIIPSEELTRGDIVYLEAGMYVPADIRLFKAENLSVNESTLTGEWLPTDKDTEIKKVGLPILGQTNMVWMGTFVTSGVGSGVVVEIGNGTEMGKIAESLNSIENRDTPIKKNIKNIARFVALVVVLVVVLIFVLGILRDQSLKDMFLLSIAIAVSAIPEGLPAAVTVVLALGMERILKKGGLVRNLQATETLGSTTVILTDKTGTLTEAKMKLSHIYTLDSILNKTFDVEDNKEVMKMAVLSSDAFIEMLPGAKENEISVHGRPLEKAIMSAGLASGISQSDLEKDGFGRIELSPFSSEKRYMASLNRNGGEVSNRLYISGAPEVILEKSKFVWRGNEKIKMTEHWIKELETLGEAKAREGMRLTAIAYKDVSWNKLPEAKKGNEYDKNIFEGLIFVGFLAFSDHVREDVRDSIGTARMAGARVIMVTGDYPETALSIAKETGITKKSKVITGADIEAMDDKDLSFALMHTEVFARVLPSQKLRLVKILRNKGEIVAMTGDGVNDAPALRSADIGIAVGSGTEVAKESSDLVLLDNNFSVIVRAIEEGRRIIDNLKKIIAYLLSTSFGEVILITGALVFALPLPILPVQILWVNIIGEGLMNFAFAFESPERDIMRRDPRSLSAQNIMSLPVKKLIWFVGMLNGLFLFLLFLFLLSLSLPIEEIRTLMFVAASIDAIFFAFSFKSFTQPFWRTNLLDNKYLIISLAVSISILILTLSLSPLKTLLSLTVLTVLDFVILSSVALANIFIIEGSKYFVFGRNRR